MQQLETQQKSITISNTLTETLRDAIITGEIEQGSKLSETKLAKQLDVSRGPLREAIRRLEGMNLIHYAPQQGAKVVTLTLDLVLEIYHAREALESKAVALATKQMSSSEIDELNRVVDRQSKHLQDSGSSTVPAESDYVFHELIIRGSKNRVIKHALLQEIYNLIKMFRYQNNVAGAGSSNALIEHRQIAYAIQQRDALLAETTMRQHIVRARERIKQHLSDQKLKLRLNIQEN
ncbi:MAG: GntR family transcriptional regulator [Acidiferrobacterales bacterium]|nr:GntR family transcriptional regulator [Acidiferrobacterales bacterium]